MRARRYKSPLEWQKLSGESVVVNGFTLTPQSQVFRIRFPWGAFVWQRPTAIVTERDGQVERLPIVDLTRSIQLGLCGLGLVVVTIVGFIQLARRKEKASHDRSHERPAHLDREERSAAL